jgi:hypothetical protein
VPYWLKGAVFDKRDGELSVVGYSGINSIKSPASGPGNVSEPRLMSQVGRLREVVCA